MEIQVKMEVPTEWTAAERIRVATILLGLIQSDIPAGRYGEIGRPNITSVLHVLHEEAVLLNQYRDDLAKMLEDLGDKWLYG